MKIKITSMESNSNLSDEEIRSYMNFEKVVENARKRSGRRLFRYSWIALPVVLGLVTVWLVIDNHRTDGRTETTSAPVPSSDRAGTGIVVPSKSAEEKPVAIDPRVAASSRDVPDHADGNTGGNPSGANQSTKAAPVNSNRAPDPSPSQSVTGRPENTRTSVKDTYVQAEPRAGYTHLYAYFSEHLSYPTEALQDSIEGIETVAFTIDKSGRPIHISITQSLGPAFDREAIRLIREMPDWTPATLNGDPVASQLSVPLTFQLKRIKKF